jgi:hypothetical protein
MRIAADYTMLGRSYQKTCFDHPGFVMVCGTAAGPARFVIGDEKLHTCQLLSFVHTAFPTGDGVSILYKAPSFFDESHILINLSLPPVTNKFLCFCFNVTDIICPL